MSIYTAPPEQTSELLNSPSFDLPQHVLDSLLAESGITRETAEQHNLRYVPPHEAAKERFRPVLNRPYDPRWGHLLLFPYFDEHAKCILWRAKLEWPGGRPEDEPKYLQPKGSDGRLYFTPGTLQHLLNSTDKSRCVVITEGEKKAEALRQCGYMSIGIPGVWNWVKPKGDKPYGWVRKVQWYKPKANTTLHWDFQQTQPDQRPRISWKGVLVYIVFDSDVATKDDLRLAERRLATALRNVGAKVKVVRILGDESDFAGKKVGIDDIVAEEVRKGRDPRLALKKLFEDEANLLPDELPKIGSVEALEYARTFQNYVERDGRKLVYHCGRFYRYEPGTLSWEALDKDDLSQEALSVLQQNYSDVVDKHAKQAIVQTQSHRGYEIGIRSSSKTPIWIGDSAPEGFESPYDMLVTRNQIVNPRSGGMIPRTADLFCPTYVDVDYDPDAPEPKRWLKLLGQTLKHDYQIAIMQEFCGFCLLPLPPSKTRTSTQKLLYILGPPGCGKGVIVRVLTSLLGQKHVASASLDSLGNRFGLAELQGKSLCTLQEVNSANRLALSRLKQITGEDMMSVEGKGKDSYSMYLPVRMMIVNNEMVKFHDPSNSLQRRVILLEAYSDFEGDPIDGLSEQIFEEEATGILNWARAGWLRLSERGFTELPQDAPGRELMEEQSHLNSSVAAFVDRWCETGPTCEIPMEKLYDAFKRFCLENGEPVESKNVFGRDLRAALRGKLAQSKRRVLSLHDDEQKQKRPLIYVGVKLQKFAEDFMRLPAPRDAQTLKYGGRV